MVARRTLALLVALITAAFVAGCAQTVTGHASFADSAGGGGTPTSSDSSSPDSSSSDSTDSSSPGSSDSTDTTTDSSDSTDSSSSGGSDDSAVCDALDKSEIERLLGGSVTLKASQSTGCQITSSNGKSMIVAVFDFLTLAEYKKGKFTNLTIGGHPAVRTDSNIIYCARSTNPEDEGLLAAYYSGLGDNGQVASALLARLLKKYSR